MSDRFASHSDEDIAQLLQEKDNKSTKTNTKLAIDLLKAKGLGFEEQCFEMSKLDGLLKSFYANVREKDGSFYSKNYITKYLLTKTEGNSMFCGPETANKYLTF